MPKKILTDKGMLPRATRPWIRFFVGRKMLLKALWHGGLVIESLVDYEKREANIDYRVARWDDFPVVAE